MSRVASILKPWLTGPLFKRLLIVVHPPKGCQWKLSCWHDERVPWPFSPSKMTLVVLFFWELAHINPNTIANWKSPCDVIQAILKNPANSMIGLRSMIKRMSTKSKANTLLMIELGDVVYEAKLGESLERCWQLPMRFERWYLEARVLEKWRPSVLPPTNIFLLG